MLTKQEKDFMTYWEQNRQKQKKTYRQFLVGIPIGLLFAIPIVINFVSGWHKRAEMEANNPDDFNPLVLIIALLLIVAFVAIFSKHHQWEMREQRYQELNSKQSVDQEDANNTNGEK
jgi:membrane protein YdbS with pleckstrin-like domain